MSEFQAVNTTLTVAEAAPRLEESTPTTPRPTIFTSAPEMASENAEDASKTPTRDSFAGMASQRPLPSSPLQRHGHARSDSKMEAPTTLKREGSHQSTKSMDASEDIEMIDGIDAKDGSAEASDDSGTEDRPSKKKKGQRFFCTEFPPCQLSFTRSEHLARHIRKHTGERPFQCHCSRRFSRLDNLRQHAQTVHVNEDIPGDSLAATGTRFQRQIRTDRVRPAGSRARASTLGSTGSHSRGHSRNLSASSITSVSTTTSSLGGEDIMRRGTPMMSNEGRSRLSLETYVSNVSGSPASQHYYTVGGQSPSGYSTPTSTTFSQGTGSPLYSSGFHSPVSIPRSVNFEPRTPGRRLSVPSGNNPFTPSTNTTYPSPYLSSVQSASGNSSMFASPTSSAFGHSRRESTSSLIDSDLRRRTWHPHSHTGLIARPGMSGLQQFQTPEKSRLVFPLDTQTRLPGIESFDHAPPPPPAAVPRRILSPMQIDHPQQQSLAGTMAPQDGLPAGSQIEQRNNRMSWDSTLQRGLTNLDIDRANHPERAVFVQHAPQYHEAPRPRTSHVTFQDPLHARQHSYDGNRHRYSDEPLTPHKNKRMAWYNGPVAQQGPEGSYLSTGGLRTSPGGSSSSEGVSTPSNGSMNEVNPAIVRSNGAIDHNIGYMEAAPRPQPAEEHNKMQAAPPYHYPPSFSGNSVPQYTTRHHPPHQAQNATYALQQVQRAPPHPISAYHPPPQPANDMQRLEALVAVATRENQAVSGH